MDEARVIPLHAGTQASRRREGVLVRTLEAGVQRAPEAPRIPEVPKITDVPDAGVVADPASRGARWTLSGESWEQRLAGGVSFLRRRMTGAYDVDGYGFDPDLTENVLSVLLRPLYRRWFRVEVNGVENIPSSGGALLVANHAGGLWALDAAMTALAVNEHTATDGKDGRFLRMLAAGLVFGTPGLGSLARKSGATLACNTDAERLLRAGELVGVWPEGFKGIGKPFKERYTLQRFGRGGFVHAALATGAPIVPVSVVGAEEIHPVLGNAKTLARLLNLPYFPLTPTFPWLGPLGLVPLPSKWYIEFGEPIETSMHGPGAAEDPVLIFDITDRVRETIQATLYRLLVQRRSVWR